MAAGVAVIDGKGALKNVEQQGIKVLRASAKTGLAVEEAFSYLSRDMLR